MSPTRHLTFANVASALALTVALGTGASYAAAHVHLPKNSVGAKQIRTNAVGAKEIKAGAVGSAEVGDGSLRASDLDAASVAGFSSPRAYGVFTSTGVMVASRSKNATVTPMATGAGDFCVTPTAASGIDPTKATIIATPDYTDGNGNFHIVQVVGAVNAVQLGTCPGGFALRTSNFTGAGFVDTPVAVSFVIP